MIVFCWHCLSHFYGQIVEVIGLKALGNYSGYNFSICLWDSPETPHFYDFEIFGRVPEPRNQYHLSFETPRYLNKSRIPLDYCQHVLMILKSLEIANIRNVRKDGHHQIPTICLIKS